MGGTESHFTFDCQPGSPRDFGSVFEPCGPRFECPGLKTCLIGQPWEDVFLDSAIIASDCEGDDFGPILEAIEDRGFCGCRPLYGYVGDDCTDPTGTTGFIVFVQVLRVIFSVYVAWKAAKLVLAVSDSEEKVSVLLKVLLSCLGIASVALVLFDILILANILTPEAATQQRGTEDEEDEEREEGLKLSVIEIYFFPIFGGLLVIAIDAAVLILNFSWARVLSGIRSGKKSLELDNTQKGLVAFTVISTIVTAVIVFTAESFFPALFLTINIGLVLITYYCFVQLGKEIKNLSETEEAKKKDIWHTSSLLFSQRRLEVRDRGQTFNEKQQNLHKKKYALYHKHMRDTTLYILVGGVINAVLFMVLAVMVGENGVFFYAEPGRLNPVIILAQICVAGTWIKAIGIINFLRACNCAETKPKRKSHRSQGNSELAPQEKL